MIQAPTRWLLNLGHAMDHMFLLIFATAVTSIAAEFGVARWEDLMPYSVAAFFFFGVGSLPSGRLGDLWGRRPMMLVFFAGMGVTSIGVSFAQSPIQLGLGLAVLGMFASIYHPVGIPMLLQGARKPGWTIGVSGLSGNLGLAAAAVITGFFVKYSGWRAAFLMPGVVCLACGLVFAWVTPRETEAPARKKPAPAPDTAGASMSRLLLIMTLAATTGSLLFNFSTNANYELLSDRFRAISQDPARIGLLLAVLYAMASLTQLLVGHLLDRFALKRLYVSIISLQVGLLALSTVMEGWLFYVVQVLFMASIFGSIPFTDAMIVRFVDDTMRSRVSGMRLAVSAGASSLAVWLIGPVVKQSGFTALLAVMAATSLVTLAVVSQLPRTPRTQHTA